jgi:uncharacterized protein YdeI (YjbR/CyaY-like superfamily)
MEKKEELLYLKNRNEWRNWLQKNHEKAQSVWVVYYKKGSNKDTISYAEAVEEALCFGWIDSKAMPIDEEKYKQFFSKRKPKSVWSKLNKERIENLEKQNLIMPAGWKMIEIAKENGYWNLLDDAEAWIIPNDLDLELSNAPDAKEYFLNLSKSDRRNILQWLVLARRPETRQNRIKEIVELAAQKLKPKQFR